MNRLDPATDTTTKFTATRIAAALGRDVRSIRRTLDGRPADGNDFSKGPAAKTYRVTSLPEKMQGELGQVAERRGFKSAERFLATEDARWEHATPIADVHADDIGRAQNRATALAPWVAALSGGTRPRVEIEIDAAAAHRQALGFTISSDTLFNMMYRAIQRDGGRGEFGRWELYLPECPKKKQPAAADVCADFVHFDSILSRLDGETPSMKDRNWAWTAMCDNLQMLLERGDVFRVARRQLVKYVFARAPWLSKSRHSLGQHFNLKWQRYCEGERNICDRRPKKSGNRKPLPLTEEDELKLIAAASGGGLARAWRTLHGAAQLSAAVVQNYATNTASKSYVPQRIRNLITPQQQMVDDMRHGPRQAKLNGAYISRDWSQRAAG